MTQGERDIILGRIDARTANLEQDMSEVKIQTTKTNGRVSAVELKIAEQEGSSSNSSRTWNIIIAILGIIIGALATLAASQI